jgi:hypothetical protein
MPLSSTRSPYAAGPKSLSNSLSKRGETVSWKLAAGFMETGCRFPGNPFIETVSWKEFPGLDGQPASYTVTFRLPPPGDEATIQPARTSSPSAVVTVRVVRLARRASNSMPGAAFLPLAFIEIDKAKPTHLADDDRPAQSAKASRQRITSESRPLTATLVQYRGRRANQSPVVCPGHQRRGGVVSGSR